jgi:aspartyl-tRNA(Asn)/glutamyl-tRNA(Gln) amidotransferase subunit A
VTIDPQEAGSGRENRPVHDGVWITEVEPAREGIRLAVKDLFDTAGVRTTYGSPIFAEHVPAESATAVRLLEEAGYVTVGKANLHELAYGVTSENPHFGTVPNPAAPGRIAGGSSGGNAAALALGLADAALGSDSGGSIRIPSACCGTTGFKPTYGLVALDGCFPLAPSFDHAGPMARTVGDCEAMLRALVPGHEPLALGSLEEVSVGVHGLEHADPLVRARVAEAAALFPRRRELDFPDVEISGDAFMREVADVHRELYAQSKELYGEDVARRIERCLRVTDAEYERAVRGREEFREQAAEAVAGVDLVLSPTLPLVAPPVGSVDAALRRRILTFTYPLNALGWPALALPCGPAEDGLPASVQLAAPGGHDALVLAAGRQLEAALKR